LSIRFDSRLYRVNGALQNMFAIFDVGGMTATIVTDVRAISLDIQSISLYSHKAE